MDLGGTPIEFIFTARHERFFKHARHMSEMSDFRRAQVGCVAVIGNKVVATGFSQQRTHPMQDYYNRYREFGGQENIIAKCHAEISMLSANRHIDWRKADVYLYRKCRSREHGNSRPCRSCEMALRHEGVKNVFFSTDDGFDHMRIA